MKGLKTEQRSKYSPFKEDGWDVVDVGWLLSIGIEVLVIFIGLQSGQIDLQQILKFDQFRNLRPSEMGDTLAGIFSALAFIWIIVTVFLQSNELKEQRHEFEAQRIATQEMAKAQGAQVKLLQVQAEIFEEEQKQRLEEYASLESEAINSQLHVLLSSDMWLDIHVTKVDGRLLSYRMIDNIKSKMTSGVQYINLPTIKLFSFLMEATNAVLPVDKKIWLKLNHLDI